MQLPPPCAVVFPLFIHAMLLRAVKFDSTHWMPGALPPICARLPTMVLNSSRFPELDCGDRFIAPIGLGLGLPTSPGEPLSKKMLLTMTIGEFITDRPPPLFDTMCDRVSVSPPLMTAIAGT